MTLLRAPSYGRLLTLMVGMTEAGLKLHGLCMLHTEPVSKIQFSMLLNGVLLHSSLSTEQRG